MTGGNAEDIGMDPPHIYVERTLAIIKPDAVHKSEEIEDIILRSGFAILQVLVFFTFYFLFMYTLLPVYSSFLFINFQIRLILIYNIVYF